MFISIQPWGCLDRCLRLPCISHLPRQLTGRRGGGVWFGSHEELQAEKLTYHFATLAELHAAFKS